MTNGDDGVTPNHDRHGAFKVGNKAGTGGAPSWVAKARDNLRALVPGAVEKLATILRDGEDRDALAAAKLILDFTVPRPKITHRVEGTAGGPLAGLTLQELLAVGRAAKNEVPALPEGAPSSES
jgi:hypothetical protein